MDKVIESFINQCDEMMIAEEGVLSTILLGPIKMVSKIFNKNTSRKKDSIPKTNDEPAKTTDASDKKIKYNLGSIEDYTEKHMNEIEKFLASKGYRMIGASDTHDKQAIRATKEKLWKDEIMIGSCDIIVNKEKPYHLIWVDRYYLASDFVFAGIAIVKIDREEEIASNTYRICTLQFLDEYTNNIFKNLLIDHTSLEMVYSNKDK